jgi:tripartite-type tricarboxylate transporter receptor subunit TctC
VDYIPNLLRRLLPAITLCAVAVTPAISHAAYPDKPIKMVVAYAAGGETDIIARLVAQYMQKHLGGNASVVVIKRPGAGGGIGFTEVSSAQPDGYTIGFLNGVELTHIPFKGASEVRIAVASKQIMVAAMNIGEALQYQKAGTPLRNLGQMSQKRSTLAPDVPTFKEQGFNVIMASLRGVGAPKNLPLAIREQLVTALQKVVMDPEFQAKAAGYFAPLRYLPPTAYAAELKDSEAGFKQLWQVMPWTEK